MSQEEVNAFLQNLNLDAYPDNDQDLVRVPSTFILNNADVFLRYLKYLADRPYTQDYTPQTLPSQIHQKVKRYY